MNDSLFPDPITPLKIVVFDLDETLGYFVEFGMFWTALETFYGRKLSQFEFNKTLDLYPEFSRPNILDILRFLKRKKQCKSCSHVMIYTNNQGPKEWAHSIKSYFESKMNTVIFDRIISAFKINGKQIEICRTTHNKTHDDFIKCTKVPANSQICFLDDVYHPEMKNDNVYYINVKPYVHDLTYDTLIDRYLESHTSINEVQFREHVMKQLQRYNHKVIIKNQDEHEIDTILTKHILHHIRIFFNDETTKTKRRIKRNGTKTRKQ